MCHFFVCKVVKCSPPVPKKHKLEIGILRDISDISNTVGSGWVSVIGVGLQLQINSERSKSFCESNVGMETAGRSLVPQYTSIAKYKASQGGCGYAMVCNDFNKPSLMCFFDIAETHALFQHGNCMQLFPFPNSRCV